MKKLMIATLLALSVPWSPAWAGGTTPLQLSLWKPMQLFPSHWDVTGFRLGGFYSRNRRVTGLDLGLFNKADSYSGGLQLGLFNYVSELPVSFGDVWGSLPLERSYLRNGHARFTGLQVGLLGNHADELKGVQFGLHNTTVSMKGFQVGGLVNECHRGTGGQVGVSLVNWVRDEFHGAQALGLVNVCRGELRGFQLGLVNYARRLHGVQVGLANMIKEGPVGFLPLVNASF